MAEKIYKIQKELEEKRLRRLQPQPDSSGVVVPNMVATGTQQMRPQAIQSEYAGLQLSQDIREMSGNLTDVRETGLCLLRVWGYINRLHSGLYCEHFVH